MTRLQDDIRAMHPTIPIQAPQACRGYGCPVAGNCARHQPESLPGPGHMMTCGRLSGAGINYPAFRARLTVDMV